MGVGMTQDEIIEMARQVGYTPFEALKWEQALTNFAKLVAAKEREACALICENYADTDSYQDETSGGITTDFHAKLIRARGEA
jgi:hypothetical protein